MNGRVYDPKLGRFLSPDPFVQAPHTVGGFNRYTYCYNNPLKYTDPSGYVPEYHLSGFDWAYSYAYDRANPRKDNGGAGSGMPGWGGNYQGIWRKMGAGGNSNPGHGFSYYMNKRGYTYAVNNNGIGSWISKDDIIPTGFSSFYKQLKSEIDTDGFSLGLRFNFNSIQIVGISDKTGLTSAFGVLNLDNFFDYEEATIFGAQNSDGQISIDKRHNRIGFVPLDVGTNYGAYQMANYRANISIRGNHKNIFVGVTNSNTPINGGQVVFNAGVSLVLDGNVIQEQSLVNGFARFALPPSSNVSLIIRGGWIVYYDSGGASVPVYHPIFWPFNLNFKDTFKLK